MPRALNSKELKERDRQVMEAAKLTEKMQARGLNKIQIKVELRGMKYKHKVIRAAFEGIESVYPIHYCENFLQKKFDGRTVPGRRIIEAGLKAGYSRKTIYRALTQCATLKKRGKKTMWKFGWKNTERRNFLGEISNDNA